MGAASSARGRGRAGGAGAGKPGRRKYGKIFVEPHQVAAQVAEMGGFGVVDGKQGRKGGGWKKVAAALGIDVEVFRDCGFQVLARCMFFLVQHSSWNTAARRPTRDAVRAKKRNEVADSVRQVKKLYQQYLAAADEANPAPCPTDSLNKHS